MYLEKKLEDHKAKLQNIEGDLKKSDSDKYNELLMDINKGLDGILVLEETLRSIKLQLNSLDKLFEMAKNMDELEEYTSNTMDYPYSFEAYRTFARDLAGDNYEDYLTRSKALHETLLGEYYKRGGVI